MKQWLGVILVAVVTLLAGCDTGYLPASFDDVADTAVYIKGKEGRGSGTIIGPNRVLTAKHVVKGNTDLTVELMDGTVRRAAVLWMDDKDAAVLKVAGAPLKHYAVIACGPMEMGEPFQWIGNAFDIKFAYKRGFVSSPEAWQKHGDFNGVRPAQANFNPGDSGSGLFNMDGYLRGIVDGYINGGGMMSKPQTGIGLMLPASEFCNSMDRLGDGITTIQ